MSAGTSLRAQLGLFFGLVSNGRRDRQLTLHTGHSENAKNPFRCCLMHAINRLLGWFEVFGISYFDTS